jgi:electron transfer flavoprotein alpha subunit
LSYCSHTHRNSEGCLPQSPETTAINSANDDTHILAPATACDNNVTAPIAAALDVAQISDITAVGSTDKFERPTCSGHAIATTHSANPVVEKIAAAADLLGGRRRQWKVARSLLAEWQK